MYPFRQQETDRLSAGGFLLPKVEGGPPRKVPPYPFAKVLPYPLREVLSLSCEKIPSLACKKAKKYHSFRKTMTFNTQSADK